MKHKIIMTLLLILGTASAMGQTRSKFEEEVSIGAQGGLNLSQVRFLHNDVSYENELGNLGWRSGASAGVAVRFIAQKHFGIQLEANYLQCGWKEDFDNGTTINGVNFSKGTTERELDYLSVPLLAHIYFGNKVRFIVNLGPKVGYLMNTSDKCGLTSEQIDAIAKDNEKDPRINQSIKENKFDYGLCVGGGIEWHAGKVDLLGEVRWTYGLQDAYDHSKSDVYQRSNNQNFTFTLGVMMPVIKFHSK